MSKLTVDQITVLALLARLGLQSNEIENLSEQLSSILGFVEMLKKIETTGVKETSQVTGLTDVTRADNVQKCQLSRQELLSNAPMTHEGYIKVKRVLG